MLGGHDCAPAEALNTLPKELRGRQLGQTDRDQWLVWSDDFYGDRDQDGIPELPVSRIPDGGSPNLIQTALTLPSLGLGGEASAISNIKRPFAATLLDRFPNPIGHGICAPAYPSVPFSRDLLYLMLHGHFETPGEFTGECSDDAPCPDPNPVAIDLKTLPATSPAVVFAGCCYGAISTRERAADIRALGQPTSLTPEESIPLALLSRGAHAYIGCTGIHYSPRPGGLYFGGAFHNAFFSQILEGHPPAAALLRAKQAYAAAIPSRGPASTIGDIAIDHKIVRQFTCLGVGW